ncbi:succinate dehydrogenase/fumarate reductase iron-sulfur subunit [bacterium]|nr:succinate dehydrogenase/fumarate reductase iron-sulfur subunit [bacterium]MBU1073766.1 succinate dehydrogenase/fumarate reductase iron-sulfur subunit [bacterium]MBU1676940.1 succinate dehydrogenase/fumarate reductase iron-sulfur subunit [bacterium]
MTIHLKIWRQARGAAKGGFARYTVEDVLPEMSLLEVLDLLNEQLARSGELPVEFDSDCREGICGTCGLVVQGIAHGPNPATTTCEVRMRHFHDGQTLTIEPFRARPFPLIKDLVVDRAAFDRIQQKGGFVTANVGSAPDANAVPIPKADVDKAMDAALCIGCGACVAACPNASASLFVSAKISQLSYLPQGAPERGRRALAMVAQMDTEGFGNCSNHGECEAVCPKEVSIENIARMRREFFKGVLGGK